MDVVENVGMRVENLSVLEAVSEKGAITDKRNRIAKFPIGMIEDAMSYFKTIKSNKKIRPDDFKLIIEGGGAPFILQCREKEKHAPIRKDLIDVVKLGDGFEEVRMISDPLTYSETDPKMQLQKKFTIALVVVPSENPFVVSIYHGAKKPADQLNIKVTFHGLTEWNFAEQSLVVRSLIARRDDD
jgi:trimethylamine:corrinoid methyltransferase-like protein